MSAQASIGGDQADRASEERREFRSYVWGVGLALVLTLTPFFVVHWHALLTPTVYYLIGVLALAQGIVHFHFFLHIGLHQKREDLQLIVFTTVLLLLLVGGTIWIMANLAGRMMLP